MFLPRRNLGQWCRELVQTCEKSRVDRIQTNSVYKNIYLTGDENGVPQTYPKVGPYIDTLSSFYYSPVDLRFSLQHYGMAGPVELAKERAAASFLHQRLVRAEVDTAIEDCVDWALVKGKTFLKMGWGGDFSRYVIQPELMAVYREDIETLDEQEAFCHSVYITKFDFQRLVQNHPDRDKLMKNMNRFVVSQRQDGSPEQNNQLMQVILGGLNPFQPAGTRNTQRGVANWMSGGRAQFSPEVLADIIRLDEIWVWDDDRDDWTTLQVVGTDDLVEGKYVHRNIFAERATKTIPGNPENPLKGHHPFVEFCPNKQVGYFWGRSEILNIWLIQKTINQRVDGINSLLRKQEDPPKFFSGFSGTNQNAMAKLRKPGGTLSDTNPNAKVQDLAPQIPAGLWESLHENEAMMDNMGGFTPTMAGRGEKGVRSQAQANTLTRNGSPRFKDKALRVERQVAAAGGLCLDMLTAHVAKKINAWVTAESPETSVPAVDVTAEPPVPGMKLVEFMLHDLDDDCRVAVDGHSASPAFAQEAEQLLFNLLKAGAVGPEELLEHLPVPDRDALMGALERKQHAQAEFIKQHPEAAGKGGKHKK